MQNKLVVGAKETVDLPELRLFGIKTRIDTGAQTSALHVDHVAENEVSGMLDFEFHPDSHDVKKTIKCSAKIHQIKWVKSSNGDRERRYIINTTAVIGELTWVIRLSLTNRSSMNHLLLMGRQAMIGKLTVDPEFDFLASREITK